MRFMATTKEAITKIETHEKSVLYDMQILKKD